MFRRHVFDSIFDAYRGVVVFFFFNDTATTEIYTLSLHDALPISIQCLVVSTAEQTILHFDNYILRSSLVNYRRQLKQSESEN